MNWRIILAGFNGFLAVAFAAFGAHGLPADMPEKLRDAYGAGAEIHLAHAAALAGLAFAPAGARWTAAFALLFCGASLFAGSVYLYALTAAAPFAMAAPAGGVTLLAGWLAFAWAGLGSRRQGPG